MTNVASAEQVRELREITGAGIMDCKWALAEAKGDLEQAKDLLRKKGLAAAGKRANRDAKEGVVFIESTGKKAALLELNCETDFVAKTDDFQKLGSLVLSEVFQKGESAVQSSDLQTKVQEASGKTGEKIAIRRAALLEVKSGYISSYRHHNFKIGILIQFEFSKEETSKNEEFVKTAKDIAMQVAALRPQFLNPTEVPAEFIEREKAIFREQVKDKPAQAQDKIIQGKLEKRYEDICLTNQKSVIDATKSIAQILETLGKKLGDSITIRRFKRFEIGVE